MTTDRAVWEALLRLAREADMDTELLIKCVDRQLIVLSSEAGDQELVEAVRRVRRLNDLGINLQGVEVILHMRRRILQLVLEVEEMQQELDRLRAAHEQELARLMQRLARGG